VRSGGFGGPHGSDLPVSRATKRCEHTRRGRGAGRGWRPKGSNRVNRGGSWNNNANNCRAANRNNNDPTNRNNNLGFRAVLPPAQPGCRKAAGLTRRPSRPAPRTKRRQTERESRPVQVGKRSFPKAPGGLWAWEAPCRLPGQQCGSAIDEPTGLVRANRSTFRQYYPAAFEAGMQPLSGLGGLSRCFPSVGSPPLWPPGAPTLG